MKNFISLCIVSFLICCCSAEKRKHQSWQNECKRVGSISVMRDMNEHTTQHLEIIEHDSFAPTSQRLIGVNDIGAIYDEKRGELYISGFAADGRGTFYFAAGQPRAVTGYHSDSMIWKCIASTQESAYGLFTLRGDSLYLFEESPAQILRLSTTGDGVIDTFQLPLQCITGGRCFDHHYFLWDTVGWKKDFMGHRRYSILRTFEYPNTLRSEKAYATINDIPSTMQKEMSMDTILWNFHLGECNYRGVVADYDVYTFRMYGDCTVVLVSDDARIHVFPIQGMPPLNVCVSPTESLPVVNKDYDILSSGNLYLLGYHRCPSDIVLLKIDVHALIHLANRYSL